MKEFILIDEFWIDFDFSIFKEYFNLLSYHYHKGDNDKGDNDKGDNYE